MEIPSAKLPKALDIPQMYLRQPTADVPAFRPIVIPPADLERPEGTQKAEEKEEKTEQPPPPKLKIPVIDIQLPIPTVEVVAVASYAAVSAVVVTTFAEPVSKGIKKKIQKFLQGKVNKWKENRKKRKDSSES
tara:strand:+ start:882 stop:1280 length:399 start_codon:yes stop_codon:yes gene_type:complete